MTARSKGLELGQKARNLGNSGHLELKISPKGPSEKLIFPADNVQEGLSP